MFWRPTSDTEKSKSMRVSVDGELGVGHRKDIVLAIIGEIGTAGTGYVIEFAGDAIRALSMEGA